MQVRRLKNVKNCKKLDTSLNVVVNINQCPGKSNIQSEKPLLDNFVDVRICDSEEETYIVTPGSLIAKLEDEIHD